jgi:glycerophosphoryl diester phosphodiesterase
VDDVEEMKRLLAMGADGLFTNFPDRMRALLGSPRGISSEYSE